MLAKGNTTLLKLLLIQQDSIKLKIQYAHSKALLVIQLTVWAVQRRNVNKETNYNFINSLSHSTETLLQRIMTKPVPQKHTAFGLCILSLLVSKILGRLSRRCLTI